uniref:Uncharacterized protein n=1 Tax=Octopus bimaculoides TaxID=37653 RepID=A0A0L8GB56_OCTBM
MFRGCCSHSFCYKIRKKKSITERRIFKGKKKKKKKSKRKTQSFYPEKNTEAGGGEEGKNLRHGVAIRAGAGSSKSCGGCVSCIADGVCCCSCGSGDMVVVMGREEGECEMWVGQGEGRWC